MGIDESPRPVRMKDEPSSPREVTRLLEAWQGPGRGGAKKLTRLVYAELRRLAHRYMAGGSGPITPYRRRHW